MSVFVNWYCIRTRPLKEASVSKFLTEILELETYLPRLKRQRYRLGMSAVSSEPLFPRYLFCRMDLQLHYRGVRYAPDVVNLVGTVLHPVAVSDTVIEELKTWTRRAFDAVSVRPTLPPGCRVEVISGPMRGLEGIVLRELSSRERVAILLSNLNCGASIVLHRARFKRVA